MLVSMLHIHRVVVVVQVDLEADVICRSRLEKSIWNPNWENPGSPITIGTHSRLGEACPVQTRIRHRFVLLAVHLNYPLVFIYVSPLSNSVHNKASIVCSVLACCFFQPPPLRNGNLFPLPWRWRRCRRPTMWCPDLGESEVTDRLENLGEKSDE